MKRERQISDEMLVKYLLGEASETEHNEVEDWISESAENKGRFDSFRLIWDQSRHLATVSSIHEADAWARFKQRTQQPLPATKQIPLQAPYKWLKIAAVLLLLAGGSWLAYFLTQTNKPQTIAHTENIKPLITPVTDTNKPAVTPSVNNTPEKTQVIAETGIEKAKQGSACQKPFIAKKSTRSLKTFYSKKLFSNNRTNGFICNSTPCPIEICIIQSVKCKHDKSSPISTCNVLEPDQSGKLHYKALNKISKHCKATIDEITITMLSTGETIVLNDHSEPSTAQNFFNHITGKKKGDVYAGMFHSDCNNNTDDCGLTFDGNYGNLILQ